MTAIIDLMALAPRANPACGAALTSLERAAATLGRSDPLASVRPRGRLAGLWKWLFGYARPTALADPHLEAMRRAVVLARHGRLGRDGLARLRGAGYRARAVAAVPELRAARTAATTGGAPTVRG